jgi:hypothetical protein
LNRLESVREPRRRWVVVFALVIAGAIALIGGGRLDTADRGY